MKSEKPRLSRIEIGTLVASALAAAFGFAYAAGPAPHLFGSLFGLAPAQTLRVSVSNLDFKYDDHKLPPGPCMVQLKVFDADGSVVVQSEFLKILPGTSFSHDLKYSDLKRPGTNLAAVDFTNRAQLRVATYVGDSLSIKGESKVEGCMGDIKMLKLSVEVFDDASGRTTFMVPVDSFLPAVQ